MTSIVSNIVFLTASSVAQIYDGSSLVVQGQYKVVQGQSIAHG